MSWGPLSGLVGLSLLSLSYNGSYIFPIGFLVAVLVLTKHDGASFLTGLKEEYRRVLWLGAGLLAGIFVLQVSFDLSVKSSQLGCGIAIKRPAILSIFTDQDKEKQYAELYSQAMRAGNQGQFSQAVTLFEQAAALFPTRPEAYKRICFLELAAKNGPAAETACGRAQQLDPDDAESIFHLGLVRSEKGDWLAAERLFRQVLLKVPNQPSAANALGVMLMKQGKYAEAVEIVQKAIEQAPQSGLYYKTLGEALVLNGECKKARQHVERARELKQQLSELDQLIEQRCQIDIPK
jgi:Flp pilus assembly protein TadD